MLVQALDGWFYKNPVIHVPRGLVTFEDFPRVMVQGGKSLKSARARAGQALLAGEISGKLLEGEAGGPYLFGGDLAYGFQFDFVLRGPIPVPSQHEARVEEPSNGESCCGFFTRFWDNEIVDHMHGRCVLPLLQRALLGEWIDGQEALLKRRLLKQCPDLRGAKEGMSVKRRIVWCLEAKKEEKFEEVSFD